jgi:hypothetical protein
MTGTHRAYQTAMRSRALLLALSLFLSVAASAQNQLRFDPPDPSSRTPVLALLHLASARCEIESTTVTRVGQQIGITLTESPLCTPVNVPPSSADVRVDLGALPAGVYRVVVGYPTILLGVAEATLVVRDANPPFEVQPNALVTAGQTVHLTGRNLVSCLSGVACEHIDVRIGDTLAEVVSSNPNEVVVKVPASLQPGTYDVTIARTNSILRATAAFHLGPPDEAFYERVLFPVFFSGPGAFGSDWRTDLTLYNGAPFPWFAPPPTIFAAACFPECDMAPQSRASVIASGPSLPAGVVEWAPRQSAAVSDFGLRVVDVSRSAQDLGTEVPVVREDDLYDRTFQLLYIPVDSRYRSTLRLYDLDGPRTFLVRVYAMGVLTPPLLERSVPLNAETSLRGGGFAVINDLLAGTPAVAKAGTVRVEIVPLKDTGAGRNGTGVKSAWGFLSITNNDTQHLTVISPQ